MKPVANDRHTPTPWEISALPVARDAYALNDYMRQTVTLQTVDTMGELIGLIYTDKTNEEGEANAAFIVRAVNAHESLVADNVRLRKVLRNLVNDWERVHGIMPEDHEARAALKGDNRDTRL